MFNFLNNLFWNIKKDSKSNLPAIAEGEFLWCIVGNIVDKHFFGQDKEIRRGSKQFRPGAKVYCIPEFGGDAHAKVRAIGRPRNSDAMISVIMQTKLIKNYRLQKVYSPAIFDKISDNSIYRVNSNYRLTYGELEKYMRIFRTYTEEI
jgi:hypothetical protein